MATIAASSLVFEKRYRIRSSRNYEKKLSMLSLIKREGAGSSKEEDGTRKLTKQATISLATSEAFMEEITSIMVYIE